jgi:histidyl-tRNA synthetase
MAALQPVRGTHDLFGEELRRHRHVAETARAVSTLYGYSEIATPIFEFVDVFARSLGDTSDVVTKEMYAFADRSGEQMVLRPENTAGVVRAVVTHGMAQHAPLKFFYYGPMFRYERPQKGRQRQFHQIGIELIGVAEPLADLEVIVAGWRMLERLGVAPRVRLELNSLGDAESRNAYRNALVDYLARFESELSEDSRKRLARNPLRILDSKDEGDRRIVAGAPSFGAHLNDASKAFFDAVCSGLTQLGVVFTHNERLVRGLDYYCHTAFEFVTETLGAQGTVMAGGRYDGLVEQLGGPALPGVGWAAGVERLAMMLDAPPPAPRAIAIVPIGPKAEGEAMTLAERLRAAGFPVELGYRGNVQKRMKAADKAHARAALLIGDDELARNVARVRDLDSGEQEDVPLAALTDRLARFR